MEKNWYVYRHIRLDKNEPFYIGIGNKKNFFRAYEINPNKRNELWKKIYNKTEIHIEIIFDNLSKDEASKKEKEFIKLYGRKDLNTGTLCNMTDGGDGIWNSIRSYETKQKLSNLKLGNKNPQFGKKQSKETILKKIKALTGLKRRDETKQKQHLSSIISGQAKKTEVYNYYDNSFIGVFNSMSEACRFLNIIHLNSKASLVAQGKRNHVKGFVFKYV